LNKTLNISFTAYLVIYFTILSILLTGCAATKYLPSPTVTTKDSIVYKDRLITLHVPPVRIKGDTVKLSDTVPCPNANWRGTAISKSSHTSVTASLSKGVITISCKEDSLNVLVDSLKAKIREKEVWGDVTVTPAPIVQEVYKMPWWGWLVIGICVLITLLALFKR
jgi:hypothetical protein